GHNMWTKDYCEIAPVHDVSARVDGSANKSAEAFLNLQWNKVAQPSGTFDGIWSCLRLGGVTYPSALPLIRRDPSPEKAGTAEILSLGRLGKGIVEPGPGTDASNVARLEAANLAQKSIKLSQQMLASKTSGYDEPYLAALVDAVVDRNVELYVVISEPGSAQGHYSGYDVNQTASHIFRLIWTKIQSHKNAREEAIAI